jgi:tRNA-modifying protein YgfZ
MDTQLFNRSDWAKVELAGPEARMFLHNLCTNDVKNLPVGAGCEAFLTTAKARVVSHFFVGHYEVAGQSVLWLDTVPGQAEKLLQTLDHYLISEQVELADRTDELDLYTVCGPNALALIEKTFGVNAESLKPLHHRTVEADGTVLQVRRQAILNSPGVDLLCPKAKSQTILEKLASAGLNIASPQVFDALRLEAGFPLFGPDIDDNRLMMEVGRTEQAICYTKGCFLGQEPIVMARDRGQINRTLLGVRLSEGDPLMPGTRLFHGDVEAGQTTSSVRSPSLGQVVALAYLKRGHQEPGTELTVEPAGDGRKAIVSALPFC